MRIHLLYNPVAGAGRAVETARELAQQVERSGHETVLTESRLEPTEAWLDPVLAGADVLVVVGGDGAMRLASASAARTGTPVYHYPLGTENLFSREFGMTASPSALLDAVRSHRVEPVDVGVANGRTFLLMASMGYDAEVIHDLAARRGGGISHLSYLGPMLRQLHRWRPPALTVRADGEVICDGLPGVVVVANSRQYAMRMNPAARASMSDGMLDVVVLPAPNRRSLVGWVLACVRGRHLEDPRLVYRTGREVVVSTPSARRYQLDGDAPEPTPGTTEPDQAISLHISLWDKRLLVLVP